jgi:hypothetical protein
MKWQTLIHHRRGFFQSTVVKKCQEMNTGLHVRVFGTYAFIVAWSSRPMSDERTVEPIGDLATTSPPIESVCLFLFHVQTAT